MLNFKSIATVLMLSSVGITAIAQQVVPGFRGKKFFIEPMLTTGFGLTTGTYLFTQTNLGIGLPLIFRPGIAAHYVTGRHTNILASYEYRPSFVGVIAETPVPFVPLYGAGATDTHTLLMNLDTHIFSFGVELSPKTMLSPVGAYTRLSVEYIIFSSNNIIDKKTTYNLKPDRSIGQHLPIGLDKVSDFDYGIGIGFGYRNVIAKRIFFDWSLSTNLTKNTIDAIRYKPKTDDYLENNKIAWHENAARDVVNTQLFMLNFGLAYPF